MIDRSTAVAAFRLRPLCRLATSIGCFIVMLALVPGCGPKAGDVTGSVVYKDKPVTSGTVTMVGKDGNPVQTEIKEDGKYELRGVPVGEVRIAVSSPSLTPQKGGRKIERIDPNTGEKLETKGLEEGLPGTELQRKTWRAIPLKYSDITQSDLKHTVTPGPNTYEIRLE